MAGRGRRFGRAAGIPLLQKFHPLASALLILDGLHRRLVSDGVVDGFL